MVVITGREPSVLVALTDELARRGAKAQLLVEPEALYEQVRDTHARAIVVVDALPRFVDGTAQPPDDTHAVPLDEVLRVARSPGRPRVVVCTSKPDRLRALRKSGLAYTTVVAGALITAHDLGLSGVEGKTVHLASGLSVPDVGLTPLGELTSALADACTSDEVGKTITVRHAGGDAWSSVVASFGAKVRVTSKTLASVAGWFGRPALPWVRASAAEAWT